VAYSVVRKGLSRNKCCKIPQDFYRRARKRNRRVLSVTQGDADAAIRQKDKEDATFISRQALSSDPTQYCAKKTAQAR
jgi:DNA replication initiation complex subunit (GINS family)